MADFAVTQIAFNPAGSYLACSSVANSISLVPLDESLGKPGWVMQIVSENLFLILGVVILLLAVLYLRPKIF